MTAEEQIVIGNVDAALVDLQERIRNNPADVGLRVFLFQLLAVNGDWDRARRQLDVLADLDPSTLAMVHTYRDALTCEALRSQIFEGKRSPLVFGEPEAWLARLIEALAGGTTPELRAVLISEAFDEAPATSGTINGDAFEWIADADARLGPVLEVVISGRYYWVPFHRIARIHIEHPEDLRDVVWTPAQFIWANGGEGFGLIPTRYVESARAESSAVRLARATEWEEIGGDLYRGLGQRMIATDGGDYGLMDCRDVVISGSA